jgi:hypothetical protein
MIINWSGRARKFSGPSVGVPGGGLLEFEFPFAGCYGKLST